ncbi:MAG: hypothetical protein GWN86_18985, partial [Desulfobacterales bacterium]|nr:hypothetical protein [Desulfobacterales bacterium]
MLERVSVIEELEVPLPSAAEEIRDRLRLLYTKFHPHPVSIHFPLGGFFFSALMLALFWLTRH